MGNGLNVRRVTGYQVRSERKSLRQISVQKVRLNPTKKYAEAGAVALTKKSLKRIKMMPERKDAVLRALENEEEARDLIVNQHQLQALKSNPTANVSLTKKQMKKLKSRARASGILSNNSMEL
jgi:hypothetical protein